MKQPATPVHNRVLKLQIRYSSLMLILSLIMGLIYREFSRPFFEGLPLVDQLHYGHAMSIAHGHTFLLGAAIPLGMALMTFLLHAELSEAATLTRLRRLFIAYIVSASANVALIVYQGLSFIAGAGQPLDAIDAGLFFGSVMVRSSLYAIFHITFAVAVIWYAVIIFRAAKAS
jgi:hypothetical protein